jgi:hypothetical protein
MEVWSSKKVPGTEAGWADCCIQIGSLCNDDECQWWSMIVNDGQWANDPQARPFSIWRPDLKAANALDKWAILQTTASCFEMFRIPIKGFNMESSLVGTPGYCIRNHGERALRSGFKRVWEWTLAHAEQSLTHSVHVLVAENRASLVPLLEEIPSNRGSGLKSIPNMSKSYRHTTVQLCSFSLWHRLPW